MKSQILRQLEAGGAIVSGEVLSRQLGISRVAIWKHIRKLQGCGYHIQAGPTGYRLIRSPDTPYPWELPTREQNIHYLDTTVSTMETARQLARQGCPEFTVVIAGTQTGGRGRMDRRWASPQGGLYLTVVLRPALPPALSPLAGFATSLVLAGTLQSACHVDARVKWPNDILVQTRKVAGMLSEMETSADRVSFVNIGIGINMNNDIPPDLPGADSLRDITGAPCSRKQFLVQFLDNLENRIRDQGYHDVIDEWKQCSATLGQQVRIVSHQGVVEGRAMDVDDGGALIVRTADGHLKKVFYGDCFHHPTGH